VKKFAVSVTGPLTVTVAGLAVPLYDPDPDTAETVTVVEALPPGATVPLSGLTETEKSKMFSVKVFERVSPPPVPVTVIV